jgi:hypothetical protein
MNVEIGAEATQFPEKEYINGINCLCSAGRDGFLVDDFLVVFKNSHGWGDCLLVEGDRDGCLVVCWYGIRFGIFLLVGR